MTTNKRGQTLSGLFISIITVSAFTVLAILWINGGGETYNISYNNTSFEQFNQKVAASELALSTEETITGANASGSTSSTSNVDLITTSAFKTFPLIAGIPIILNNLFVGVAEIIGIPESIVTLVFSLVTFAIVAILILLIFRVDVQR